MSRPPVSFEDQIARIWDHIRGFHALHLLDTGARLGFFDAFARAGDEGLSPEDLAAPRGLHLPYVRIWWRTAIAWEFLDLAGNGRARLAPHLDAILARPGDPRYLLPYVTGSLDHFGPDMRRHDEFMATGAIHPFQAHDAEFTRAIGAMTDGLHALLADRILAGLEQAGEALRSGGRLLDVGCGTGQLLLKTARAFPSLRAVGIDLDEDALPQARRAIDQAGLAERVEVHDARTWSEVPGTFDAITMVEVLHEIPLSARADVLAMCRRVLKPDGRLVILDETYPSSDGDLRRPEAALAVQTQYNEMTWGNVVPTREEQEDLLREAGFEAPQRTDIGGIFSLLVARPGRTKP